jgi:hypothetical protein
MSTLRKVLMQPVSMPQSLSRTQQRLRHYCLIDVLLLWPTGILAGIVSGALMNALNGWISTFYFYAVLHIASWPEVWYGAIEQGSKEGFWFGVFFSTIFTIVVAVISRMQCPYSLGLRALLRSVSLILAVAAAGGITGVLFSLLRMPLGLPLTLGLEYLIVEALRFYWVLGCILGIYFGGMIAVIAGCIWFSADWREYKAQHEMKP